MKQRSIESRIFQKVHCIPATCKRCYYAINDFGVIGGCSLGMFWARGRFPIGYLNADDRRRHAAMFGKSKKELKG